MTFRLVLMIWHSVSLARTRNVFADTLDQALDAACAATGAGRVVLSTCNRTELYLSVEEQDNLQEVDPAVMRLL